MVENTTTNRFVPKLDDMLTCEQFAEWMQTSKRNIAEKSSGSRPTFVAFKPSPKIVQYHPRTILAVLAQRAGVPLETVAASYGIQAVKSQS